MKPLTSIIAITIAMMLSVPAAAQAVYNNGPINGNNDAWTINLTFIVSDTFTISNGGASVTGLSFGAWLSPGDTLTSAEVSITSLENGGTTYFDQVVNFNGNSFTISYKGTIAGDSIKFTRERDGGEGQAQEFTAKRAS